MAGQGTIVGVGAMEYPAEFSGMNPDQLVDRAISKIMTLTSTYDHRIIQGAQSGEFLRRVHELLLADDFYDEIFNALKIPYEPVRWRVDRNFRHEGQISKEAHVIELINAYRTRGHLMADTDPLEYTVRKHPDLDITSYGLTLWDLDREFPVGGFAGEKLMKLRDILGVLRDAYCRRVGVEYRHITDPEQRRWLEARIEVKSEPPTRDEQLHILGRLNVAEAFETFLQTKYVGQKRFSLEGAETVIALLDAVLTEAAAQDLDEVVIGMPHRGRLNVLANIVGKPYSKIFNEFEGNIDPSTAQGSGDVKYHLGAEGTFHAADGKDIAVSLTANPSHLEAVDPVLEGIVRAKQDLLNQGQAAFTVLPLLMHGDAAFAGQGVVAETLNLSQLRGYRTGGTVHVIVNNQVGFTTSPSASRSSLYSTDVARMIAAPIFHVNGDDPEACVRVAKLAVEYRREFNKDVVIDMVCYRRRGHNEADNPSFTQPLMYDIIDAKRSVRKLYTEALVGRGDITLEDAEAALKDFQAQLEKVFVETRNTSGKSAPEPDIEKQSPSQQVTTAVSLEVIKRIARRLREPAGGLHAASAAQAADRPAGGDGQFRRRRLGHGRAVRVRCDGHRRRRGAPVRAGQPARHVHPAARGAHRPQHRRRVLAAAAPVRYTAHVHGLRLAALRVRRDGLRVRLLGRARRRAGVLGGAVRRLRRRRADDRRRVHRFRRGEVGAAQRRDAAAAARLRRAGPRPLVRPSRAVPADVRREQHDGGDVLVAGELLPPAAPPGALAGAPSAHRVHAEVAAATEGRGEPARRLHHRHVPAGAARSGAAGSSVRRVLLCSGKVYYDLAAARKENGRDDVAIVRVEQLYPLPVDEIRAELNRYPDAEVVWVQEEPANQGGFPFIALNLPEHLDGRQLLRVTRRASASPAVGSHGRARGAAARDRRVGLRLAAARCTSPIAASRNSSPGAATRMSAWNGWPAGCRPSSTSTPSSRRRSSGWPPGWRATTRTTTSAP